MPITRLPLAANLEQRSAVQDKDSLLTNVFVDKSDSGVVYATKRPGFMVGAEGTTVGTNRGIFYNPQDDEFYFVDETGGVQTTTLNPSPPEIYRWSATSQNIPITDPSIGTSLFTGIIYEFGNSLYSLVMEPLVFGAPVYFYRSDAPFESWTPLGSPTAGDPYTFRTDQVLVFDDLVYSRAGFISTNGSFFNPVTPTSFVYFPQYFPNTLAYTPNTSGGTQSYSGKNNYCAKIGGVYFAQHNNGLISSPDAITWDLVAGVTGLPAITWSQAMLFQYGSRGIVWYGNSFYSSLDGINWTFIGVSYSLDRDWMMITVHDGNVILSDGSSGLVASSSDLPNFTELGNPDGDYPGYLVKSAGSNLYSFSPQYVPPQSSPQRWGAPNCRPGSANNLIARMRTAIYTMV